MPSSNRRPRRRRDETDEEFEKRKATAKRRNKWANKRFDARGFKKKNESTKRAEKNSYERLVRASRTDEERATDCAKKLKRNATERASMDEERRRKHLKKHYSSRQEVRASQCTANQNPDDWRATVDDLLPKINSDSGKFFDNFETSPFRSLLLWHLNSGYAAFRGVQEEDMDDLIKQILDERLSSKERFSLVSNFMKLHKFGTQKRLPACAACGVRVDDPFLYELDVDIVSELQGLRLTHEQEIKYKVAPPDNEENPWIVDIVVDSFGTKKTVDTRDIYSCYKASDGNDITYTPNL